MDSGTTTRNVVASGNCVFGTKIAPDPPIQRHAPSTFGSIRAGGASWFAACLLGMLSAIPKTPLHARLKNEGRLDLDDEQPYGTNVIPLGMTRDELRDGFVGLMQELYDPDFYFERLESLFLTRQFDWARARNAYWRKHPWKKLKSQSVDAVLATGTAATIAADPNVQEAYLGAPEDD